ncbi:MULTISPECIES: hypothetical protein [unclassified Pseudoalteromonas]|uniref:hypothetical protein n=1 Tax=unclassified Pseudoalteromonas TaxID=194690 RepID=UPI002096DF1A|nr:hypothetical protein [Pseudoalteromonas sp. XMcav2-N]MCO7188582.1 hypothetical protein [Pseudoalteromonas sp. XMcav2-N]
MKPSIKRKVPLAFLTIVSIWWWFYYSSFNALNAYGNANYEWLFMLDTLLVLPVLCFFCESDKQKALLKAAVLCCTSVFIGSLIIPEHNKVIFHFLESGRYFVLSIILVLELSALITVCLAVRALLAKQEDPDLAVANPIEKIFGSSFFSSTLALEGRVWSFALFASRIQSSAYKGKQHFYYDKKDGAQSNLLGFILLIVIEIPLVHLLLHFLWSSTAANITTGLTLFGLVFFFAEYKAVGRRPISIYGNNLIIRYGLYAPFTIPLDNISEIRLNNCYVKRSSNVKRFNYSGVPNVVIKLSSPINGKNKVYLGVNVPETFINTVKDEKVRHNKVLKSGS